MRRMFLGFLTALLVLPLSMLSVMAQESALAELGYPEIRVTTDGTTYDFPSELEA